MSSTSSDWNHRLRVAQEMLPRITRLHQDRGIVVSVFGRLLVGATDIDIIRSHRYARRITSREMPLEQTLPILRELDALPLRPAPLDLERLATGFAAAGATTSGATLRSSSPRSRGAEPADAAAPHTDVVLYGFGRIGRILARILIGRGAMDGGLRLRGVVVRKKGEQDLVKRASLLRRDSVHGPFNDAISVDEVGSGFLRA